MNTAAFRIDMPTPSKGRVLLLPSQFELSSSTTEQTFRSSADGSTSTVWLSNPPHVSYRLAEAYAFDGHAFSVVVWFSESTLVAVELSLASDTPHDADWGQWDAAREQTVNQLQTDLLIRRYGSHPVSYDWGTIRSDHDPRGGGTSITIRFDPRC